MITYKPNDIVKIIARKGSHRFRINTYGKVVKARDKNIYDVEGKYGVVWSLLGTELRLAMPKTRVCADEVKTIYHKSRLHKR